MDLSVVLACYHEEPIFERSVAEIFRVLDATRYSYEVVFVDDGSRDRTRRLIEEVVRSRDNARAIFHERNVGRGGTVADGLRAARGAIAGYLDIDLEVHARYIPSCVQAIEDGADVAVARRVYLFSWRSLDRYVASRCYAWLVRRLLRVPLRDTETGFKFFRRERILPVLDRVRDARWFWDTEVMVRALRADLEVTEVPALFLRRLDKRSSVRVLADSVEYFQRLLQFRRELEREKSAP